MTLTPLGLKMVDPTQQKAAKVEAFLNVPLYSKLYETYKGNTLPPPAGFENEMAKLGVQEADRQGAPDVPAGCAQAGFLCCSARMSGDPDGPGPAMATEISLTQVGEKRFTTPLLAAKGALAAPAAWHWRWWRRPKSAHRGTDQTLPPANTEWRV